MEGTAGASVPWPRSLPWWPRAGCHHRQLLTCVHNFLGATQGPSQRQPRAAGASPGTHSTAPRPRRATAAPSASPCAPACRPQPPRICTPTGSPPSSRPGTQCICLMCCHGRAAWGRLAVPVPGLCPGGGTCCLLTWKVSAGGLARRGDSWGRSQPQHRPSRLLPGGGFLHPSAGSPAQGQPGDRASSAGHRCPRWARTGTGRAGRAPHLGAMLTAPMGSRAGLCSVLHNGMSRGSPAAQETPGRWGALAASRVPTQQHPLVPALPRPRAPQQHPADGPPHCPRTLCPAQGGLPSSAQGCKRVPPGKAKRGHVPRSGAGAQLSARGSAPRPSHGGDGCWGAGTRTQGPPAQPSVAGMGSPLLPGQQGQPGRAQPAAPHSCGAEPPALAWLR